MKFCSFTGQSPCCVIGSWGLKSTTKAIISAVNQAYILIFSILAQENRVRGRFSSFQTALKTRRVCSKVPFMHQFEKYFSKLFWSAVFKRLCPPCFSVWVSLAFEKAGFASKLQPDCIINKGPNCDAISCNSCNIHERNSESSNS